MLQVLLVARMFRFFFLDSLYLRRVLGYNSVALDAAARVSVHPGVA
jgi:hypothetical protein